MTTRHNQSNKRPTNSNNDNSSTSVRYAISDAGVRDLNEIRYMLDTDICSYIIKNQPSKVRDHFFKVLDQGPCISDITLAELCYGVENNPYFANGTNALLSFLGLVKIIPLHQSNFGH